MGCRLDADGAAFLQAAERVVDHHTAISMLASVTDFTHKITIEGLKNALSKKEGSEKVPPEGIKVIVDFLNAKQTSEAKSRRLAKVGDEARKAMKQINTRASRKANKSTEGFSAPTEEEADRITAAFGEEPDSQEDQKVEVAPTQESGEKGDAAHGATDDPDAGKALQEKVAPFGLAKNDPPTEVSTVELEDQAQAVRVKPRSFSKIHDSTGIGTVTPRSEAESANAIATMVLSTLRPHRGQPPDEPEPSDAPRNECGNAAVPHAEGHHEELQALQDDPRQHQEHAAPAVALDEDADTSVSGESSCTIYTNSSSSCRTRSNNNHRPPCCPSMPQHREGRNCIDDHINTSVELGGSSAWDDIHMGNNTPPPPEYHGWELVDRAQVLFEQLWDDHLEILLQMLFQEIRRLALQAPTPGAQQILHLAANQAHARGPDPVRTLRVTRARARARRVEKDRRGSRARTLGHLTV